MPFNIYGLYLHVYYTINSSLYESQNFSTPEDISAYDGLELRIKGDGRRYKLILRTNPGWDTVGYTWSFDTVNGEWQTVSLFLVLMGLAFFVV